MANKGFSSFNTAFARASVGNDAAPTIWTYNSTDTLTVSPNIQHYEHWLLQCHCE